MNMQSINGLKIQFRKRFGQKELVIFIIISIIAGFFTYIAYRPGFLYNSVNFLFCLGVFHILIGLSGIVGNIGMFNAFRYTAYKSNFHRHGNADPTVKPLGYTEYNLAKKKKRVNEYFIVGIPLTLLSLALLTFLQ
jgi:hypothetical protein